MPEDTYDVELEKDRAAVLEIHRRYNEEAQYNEARHAHADTELLAQLWDDDPRNVFFNLSGHNYRGLAHWSKLWDYYRDRLAHDLPWITWDENVTVKGDVAWVTSLRLTRIRWVGKELGPLREPGTRISRTTEVMMRRDGQWKVVHAHFSYVAMTPRPGNV